MRAVGIRASNKNIFYCITEELEEGINILEVSNIIVPQALIMPDRLSFIRNTIFSILLEYKVESAWLRIAEINGTLNNSYIERINIEGVIQELISNCGIKHYGTGRKNSIASRLGENIKDINDYIDGKSDYCGIDNWSNHKKEEREAILSSIIAIDIE